MPARLTKNAARYIDLATACPDNLPDAECRDLFDSALYGFAFTTEDVFEAYENHAIFFAGGDTDLLRPCEWDTPATFIEMPLPDARRRAAELSERLQLPVIILDGDALVEMAID